MYTPTLQNAPPIFCILRKAFTCYSSLCSYAFVAVFVFRITLVVLSDSSWSDYDVEDKLSAFPFIFPLLPVLILITPQMIDESFWKPKGCRHGFATFWQEYLTGALLLTLLTLFILGCLGIVLWKIFTQRDYTLHILNIHTKSLRVAIHMLGAAFIMALLSIIVLADDNWVRPYMRKVGLKHTVDYLDLDDMASSIYGTIFFIVFGTLPGVSIVNLLKMRPCFRKCQHQRQQQGDGSASTDGRDERKVSKRRSLSIITERGEIPSITSIQSSLTQLRQEGRKLSFKGLRPPSPATTNCHYSLHPYIPTQPPRPPPRHGLARGSFGFESIPEETTILPIVSPNQSENMLVVNDWSRKVSLAAVGGIRLK